MTAGISIIIHFKLINEDDDDDVDEDEDVMGSVEEN